MNRIASLAARRGLLARAASASAASSAPAAPLRAAPRFAASAGARRNLSSAGDTAVQGFYTATKSTSMYAAAVVVAAVVGEAIYGGMTEAMWNGINSGAGA